MIYLIVSAVAVIVLLGAAVISQLTIALTNTDLSNTPASPSLAVPIVRFGVNSVGDVPPSWWWRQSGTCVANSMANDIGSCVNGSDGNSFIAFVPPTGLDLRQFGVKFDGGVTDNSTALQAAFNWFVKGNTISCPSGYAQYNTPIAATQASAGISSSFVGAGKDQCTLAYNGTSGTTALSITENGFQSSTHWYNFTLCSTHAGGVSGLNLIQGFANSNAANTAPTDIDINVKGCDGYAASDYFQAGIIISNISNVDFHTSNFVGIGSTPSGTIGIVLSGTPSSPAVALNFPGITVNYLYTGILVGTNVQGVTVTKGSNFFACNTCINAPVPTGTDQLTIADSQFNPLNTAIVANVGAPIITGNLFVLSTSNVGAVNLSSSGGGYNFVNNNCQKAGSPSGTYCLQSTGGSSAPGIITNNTYYQVATGNWFTGASGITETTLMANNSYVNVTHSIVSAGMKIIPDTASIAFSGIAACASGLAGRTVPIFDSSTTTWGNTITSGGAGTVLGYCDGTNWTVAAK